MWVIWLFFCLCLLSPLRVKASSEEPPYLKLGIDRLFEPAYCTLLQGKKVGLITNHSAINADLLTTFDLLKNKRSLCSLCCVFAPEHGFYGDAYAHETIEDQYIGHIPLYGLFGARRRPTKEMLDQVDVLVYDIQDLGSRSYTFISTLFYCMEEAAKASKPLIILDRPNPMGGMLVDGPAIEEKWRSFLGYVNVPYCHGMTVGELARLFNEEYRVGCKLTVVPMSGWRREMTFRDTTLPWMSPSPQIPEAETAFFYATTGLIGHCSLVNIGIGYTLPFKLIGAPWIDAQKLADALNAQNLPGVHFRCFYFRPFFGKFKLKTCQGVRIFVSNPHEFLPMTTQFTIIGVLKNLYPRYFNEAMAEVVANANKRDVFNKLVGSESILDIMTKETFFIWKLREICQKNRAAFLPIRKKYLTPEYNP